MQIILLDETRFDEFAFNHPNHSYFQTSNYGKFMSKQGYNAYYFGMVDDTNQIKAATLVLVKNDKENNKRKMGYAPRGFLIDWNDDNLVSEFTKLLKEFLANRSFTFLKVDPAIIYKEHNLDGSEKTSELTHDGFVGKMQGMEYIHLGYNNGTEASKLRWNAYTTLNPNLVTLYNTISKDARDKIKEASALGGRVYKGSNDDINMLYDLISKPKPSLEYFLDYYHFFNANAKLEIYFTKLEPATYVNSSRNIYEKEQIKNNELNAKMQDLSIANRDLLINEKMKSDELLADYKNKMVDAINMFQSYPNGIVVAGTALIKCGKKVYIVANGIKEEFKKNYPDYLLYWHLFQELSKQGYEVVDFNGLTGNYLNDERTKYKVELSNHIVEYVGEFDLVINKKGYYTGSKLNPIISWLNKPI